MKIAETLFVATEILELLQTCYIAPMHSVFVYGTLMFPNVISAVLGREVTAKELTNATLQNHRRIAVQNEAYPTAIAAMGYRIAGKLLQGVTETEMRLLDAYEGETYARVAVSVVTDTGDHDVFTYLDTHETVPSALRDWDPEHFENTQMQSYLREL